MSEKISLDFGYGPVICQFDCGSLVFAFKNNMKVRLTTENGMLLAYVSEYILDNTLSDQKRLIKEWHTIFRFVNSEWTTKSTRRTHVYLKFMHVISGNGHIIEQIFATLAQPIAEEIASEMFLPPIEKTYIDILLSRKKVVPDDTPLADNHAADDVANAIAEFMPHHDGPLM